MDDGFQYGISYLGNANKMASSLKSLAVSIDAMKDSPKYKSLMDKRKQETIDNLLAIHASL